MKKNGMKKLNLIDLINERNKKIYEDADGLGDVGVSELHFHKMLFIIYGQFYTRFKKELFNCNFQAWKFGPVEMKFRELWENKKHLNDKYFDIVVSQTELKYLLHFNWYIN